jgi:hypothetical protein
MALLLRKRLWAILIGIGIVRVGSHNNLAEESGVDIEFDIERKKGLILRVECLSFWSGSCFVKHYNLSKTVVRS